MKDEPRYLVYRNVNGRITAEIQYGMHREGIRRDESEVQRIELLDYNLTIETARLMYPFGKEVIRQ